MIIQKTKRTQEEEEKGLFFIFVREKEKKKKKPIKKENRQQERNKRHEDAMYFFLFYKQRYIPQSHAILDHSFIHSFIRMVLNSHVCVCMFFFSLSHSMNMFLFCLTSFLCCCWYLVIDRITREYPARSCSCSFFFFIQYVQHVQFNECRC